MTDREYPYEVIEAQPVVAAPPASNGNGQQPHDLRVRFRTAVKVKHMRKLRLAQFDMAQASVGDIADILTVYLAGVDKTDFATPDEAARYVDELDTADLFKIADAFAKFRGVEEVPPVSARS